MTDSLDEFVASLADFRPRGELQSVERVLVELERRARDDEATQLWVRANVRDALHHLGVPTSLLPRVRVHLTEPLERLVVIPLRGDSRPALEADPFAEAAQRAATDLRFRALLLADPARALGLVAGESLPQNLVVRVRQNTVAELHLPLPADVREKLAAAAALVGLQPPD